MIAKKMQKSIIVAGISALLITSTGLNAAQAADFSLKTDKVSLLTAVADTVTATISGLAEDQGIYVRLCATPAEAVANASFRPTQCDGQGKWVSNLLASQLIGAGKAGEVIKLDVKAVFTAKDETVDCTKVACAIHTRRDHFGGASDFALDRYYPVSFGPASASATLKGGRLTVVVRGAAGKNLSFTVAKKVYNRLATNQNYVFSLATKASSVQLVAKLDGKSLLSKNLKK